MITPSYRPTSLKSELSVKSIVSLHYFEYTTDFAYPGESHDFWELVYADKSSLKIDANEKQFTLNHGEAFLHPPMEYHNIHTDGVHSANSIIISFHCNCKALYELTGKPFTITPFVRSALFSIINSAKECFHNHLGKVYDEELIRKDGDVPFAAEQIIKNYLELLLIDLIRNARSVNGDKNAQRGIKVGLSSQSEQSIVAKATEYLEKNSHQKITFDQLCREFSVSHTTMKKYFGNTIGCGAMDYFMQCRINEAKRLIRTGTLNFTEIANELNFGSIHHFSKMFKQKTGMSPSEYSQSIKALLDQ